MALLASSSDVDLHGDLPEEVCSSLLEDECPSTIPLWEGLCHPLHLSLWSGRHEVDRLEGLVYTILIMRHGVHGDGPQQGYPVAV